MIINNGIISNGNNNTNVINNTYDFPAIFAEINYLEKYSKEKYSDLKIACQNKDGQKLVAELKKLKSGTIQLIKKLGLKTLETLIEKFILNN